MEYSCPKCMSENIYFSKKKQTYICEDCEFEFQVKKQVKAQKIFFSYGHDKNEPLVLMIKNKLEERGHTIWIDKTEIHGGDDWRRSITDGLVNTSAVISFLSSHSVRNPGVCLDELKIALCIKHGYIKTILLESEEDVKVPTTVSDVQWLDLSDWQSFYDIGGQTWENWFDSKIEEIYSIVESDEAKSFSGEIQILKDLLNPNLLDSKEQYLLGQQYIGRQWLEEKVNEWIKNEKASRAFVIVAGPGIGKSCFAAHMLHYNPNVKCGLFCEWDKPQTTDTKSVIRTIAFRLASKMPDYRRLLINMFEETSLKKELISKSAEELFELLLVEPLNSLIDGDRGDCVIIIDGLDEATNADGDKLMHILSDNLKHLPTWVKFVLTSRPEHGVENIFKEYNPFVIVPDNHMNYEDIRNYFVLNLKDELQSIANKVEIINKLVEKSEGSFLYANLVVNSIKCGRISINSVENYPTGLSEFYYRNFKRKYQEIGSYKAVRNILELIISTNTFPVVLLDEFNIDAYDYADFQNSLGSMVSEREIHLSDKLAVKCITFSHKSILDWLIDKNKSGEYFVDVVRGVKKFTNVTISMLKEYGMKKLTEESLTPNNLIYKFLENNISSCFSNGSCWSEFESFLLDEVVPYVPYWKDISRFPTNWNLTKLIQRIHSDTNSKSLFLYLQNTGDNRLALRLFELLQSQYGISELHIDLFKIYTDLVHLGGEYKKAVELDDEYLKRYTIEDIMENTDLLNLKTRMLHHSKFFKSSNELYEEVSYLLRNINKDTNYEAYMELLIMGGNLGTLMGNIDFAKKCNDECLTLAIDKRSRNYELRAIRKKVDLLKFEHKFDEAFEIINSCNIDENNPQSRYEIYLLCSKGEVYRYTDNFDKAFYCYEKVKDMTNERGIGGWLAHSILAMGCLMYDDEHIDEAKSLFEDALERYCRIGQEWGIITTEIYLLMIKQKKCQKLDKNELNIIKDRVNKLNYYSFLPYLEKLDDSKSIDFLPLMFI